jgi:hypothetical protein
MMFDPVGVASSSFLTLPAFLKFLSINPIQCEIKKQARVAPKIMGKYV